MTTTNIMLCVMLDEQRKLSEELLKVFPAQDEVNAFCKSDYIATFYCHQ